MASITRWENSTRSQFKQALQLSVGARGGKTRCSASPSLQLWCAWPPSSEAWPDQTARHGGCKNISLWVAPGPTRGAGDLGGGGGGGVGEVPGFSLWCLAGLMRTPWSCASFRSLDHHHPKSRGDRALSARACSYHVDRVSGNMPEKLHISLCQILTSYGTSSWNIPNQELMFLVIARISSKTRET